MTDEQLAASQGQPDCAECGGSGVSLYPSTARGKGGQAFTSRPCEKCQAKPCRASQGQTGRETRIVCSRCGCSMRVSNAGALRVVTLDGCMRCEGTLSGHAEEDEPACRASQTAAMRGEEMK